MRTDRVLRRALVTTARYARDHRRGLREIGEFLVFAAIAAAIITIGSSRLSYDWQWFRVPRYLFDSAGEGLRPGVLLRGLGTTLQISALGLVLAAAIGLLTALFRLSRSVTANFIAQVYIEAVRNTPLLIQLFLVYFVIAPIVGLSPFASAVVALSLFEGAYASEIIRGAIVSIPRHQWESCYCLGLTSIDTYRHVVLPQALRRILPPLTGQAVSLVKDSALVSTIAISDLTMAGSATVSNTFLTFEIWFTVAAIYLIINGLLSLLSHLIEVKLRIS